MRHTLRKFVISAHRTMTQSFVSLMTGGGRAMASMLPRALVEHFADTSFATEVNDSLAGFLV